MWHLYILASSALLALVNYIDEYLTDNNVVQENAGPHKRIGGLLLISALMSFGGAYMVSFIVDDFTTSTHAMMLIIASGILHIIIFASYFYLLALFPAYQVIPLFQIGSIWVLIYELFFGASIGLIELLGVGILITGAYILDAGGLQWRTPTKLLITFIPVTLVSALTVILVRIASYEVSGVQISFYQLLTIGMVGVLLFVFVKPYREGLLQRVHSQGANFLGFSCINEALSEAAYFLSNLSIASAPFATYVSAMNGTQGAFLVLLFFLFPRSKVRGISSLQVVAILSMMVGVILIEGWK